MTGFRISRRRYANPPIAAFDGEGSRRRGGRWTPPGIPAAYASNSLALAQLEYLVHLDPQDAPADLVWVRIVIPEDIRIDIVSTGTLPENWFAIPAPVELQGFGAKMVTLQRIRVFAGALGNCPPGIRPHRQPGASRLPEAPGFGGGRIRIRPPIEQITSVVEVTYKLYRPAASTWRAICRPRPIVSAGSYFESRRTMAIWVRSISPSATAATTLRADCSTVCMAFAA
jgi:hypothetical protein